MNQAFDLYMSILRNKETKREQFRWAAYQLTTLLVYDVLQKLPTESYSITTPLGKATGVKCVAPIMLVPILRSGITMVDPFLEYFPMASIGVVGLKRDEETAQAAMYYYNIPEVTADTQIIILDPMIATGGTGVETLDLLEGKGVEQKQIMYVSIVSAPEGVRAITDRFPDITCIVAAHDTGLNADKFIVPGLGDYGDRYFGTIG